MIGSYITLEDIIKYGIEINASDINITEDNFLACRVKKSIIINKDMMIYRDYMTSITEDLTNDSAVTSKIFNAVEQDGSFTYKHSDGMDYYFRYNIALTQGLRHITIRKLINTIPSKESIGLDKNEGLDFYNICMKQKEGLYLVIGATGSGKSTTLTCVVDGLLRTGIKCITLEAPIEFHYDVYLYNKFNSIIIQREVEKDTLSFEQGLRAAMRQNPDVILVGEIRDPASAVAALQAANTGHVVLATLHASSVDLAIERMKWMVQNITNDFSFLKAVMFQRLDKTPDGNVVAYRDLKIMNS